MFQFSHPLEFNVLIAHVAFYPYDSVWQWWVLIAIFLRWIVGKYQYGDDTFEASGSSSGATYSKCRAVAVRALKVDEPACTHMKCTFGGVWNGGGGDGQKNLFVASFFYDRAAQVSPFEFWQNFFLGQMGYLSCLHWIDETKQSHTQQMFLFLDKGYFSTKHPSEPSCSSSLQAILCSSFDSLSSLQSFSTAGDLKPQQVIANSAPP